MKILWLSHYVPYPPKAGMLIRSHNLLKQLCAEYTVDLVALARPDTLRAMYPSVEEGLADAERALRQFCEHVTLVRTTIGADRSTNARMALASLIPGPPYTVRWLSSLDMRRAVTDARGACDYDLVHCDTISLAQFVVGAPSHREPPLALNHHNVESEMLFRRARQEPNALKKAYFWQEAARLRRYERSFCRRFAVHLTCSTIDANRLLGIDDTLNVATIPNAVDVDYFAPQPDITPHPGGLVFAGGLNWYPNRDAMEYLAAEVWPLLVAQRPAIQFDLIGKNPSEALLRLAGRDSRFRVHGFVDDVRPYLARAQVYVCPIRDGGGTKLKILDALAMGKAIVAHPIAAEGIDVTPERDILLAETPSQFVAQTLRVLDDEELRSRIQASARALAVSRYSAAGIGRDLRDLYRAVAKTSRYDDTAAR